MLPGVVLLTLVLQAVQAQPALHARLGATPTIEQVKFTAPVRPGARLHVQLTPDARGVGFALHEGAQAVARGRLLPG